MVEPACVLASVWRCSGKCDGGVQAHYPETRHEALLLPALHNLMFVLPLVFVIVATFLGNATLQLFPNPPEV